MVETKTNIQILASGSEGNQTVFEYNGKYFVVDAGVNYFSAPVSQTEAIFITHGHHDHAKYRHYYQERGYNVMGWFEDKRFFEVKDRSNKNVKPINMGTFSILVVSTRHGVWINHALIVHNNITREKFFYATDLHELPAIFFSIKNKFDKILIEINYDIETLDKDNSINLSHMYSKLHSHLSFETFVEQKVIEKSDEFIILHFNPKYLNIEKVREYFEKNNKKVFFFL